MPKRAIQWLLPVLAFLLIAVGSPAALAHAGHAHGEAAVSSQAGAPAPNLASESSAVAVRAADHRLCDCPGEHCGCTSECRALCAAAAGVAPNDVALGFPALRPDFIGGQLKAIAGWAQSAEPEPPRPIA